MRANVIRIMWAFLFLSGLCFGAWVVSIAGNGLAPRHPTLAAYWLVGAISFGVAAGATYLGGTED